MRKSLELNESELILVPELTLADGSTYSGQMKKASNGHEVIKHGKGT